MIRSNSLSGLNNQAEALSEAFKESQETTIKDLATKQDIEFLHRDMKELESIGISIFDTPYQIVVAVMALNVSKKTHYAYAIKPKN